MRLIRVLLAAIFAGAALASPVAANHETDVWWSQTESNEYVCCYTNHSTGDSFRTRVYMTWDSTHAAHQRTNQANGIKFTIDQNDKGLNVEAYLFGTTLLNPYYDFDDDNNDSKYDEAEIVSESNSFPAANTQYYSSVRWSHSYTYTVHGYETWGYDPDGGYIEFDENLSTAGCPFFCDKWDTHCCNINLQLNRSYPSNPQFAATATSSLKPTAGNVPSARVATGRQYRAIVTIGGAVHLSARIEGGLDAYARATRELARTTAELGPAEGVITFAYPLSWNEFLAVEALGVSVQDMEFVTKPDANDLRVTYAMTRHGAEPEWVEQEANEAKVELMGIVSANVTVPDVSTLERLEASGYVYLVDLSIADFKRLNHGATDVIQNDLFWPRAGWL